MNRDFTTPRKDFPTPEDIWDYSQNVESLYSDLQRCRTNEQLRESVRVCITCYNEAQAAFEAPTYAGSTEDVFTYFEIMEMDVSTLQLELSEILVGEEMTRAEMIAKAAEVDIKLVDDDEIIGRLNEGELQNLLLHLSA